MDDSPETETVKLLANPSQEQDNLLANPSQAVGGPSQAVVGPSQAVVGPSHGGVNSGQDEAKKTQGTTKPGLVRPYIALQCLRGGEVELIIGL